MTEESVQIGDRFAIGSAEVIVTQPRMPCYKLGVRFKSNDMIKHFLESGRPGFYLAVTREGEVGAGDSITQIARAQDSVAVTEIVRLYIAKNFNNADVAQVRRAIAVEALPESWKEYLHDKLSRLHK
jgi:MOSC domain-containing protein YiiM